MLPPQGRTPKNFSSQTVQYISRVLKAYAKVLVKGDLALPPIIHPLKSVAQPPLANCRSILRMWDARAPGGEVMVKETVRREMDREHQTYDHITLLGASPPEKGCTPFGLHGNLVDNGRGQMTNIVDNGNLPAPSAKALWAADSRDEWGPEYKCHLADWASDIPLLKDLWPHETEAIPKERICGMTFTEYYGNVERSALDVQSAL
ncbi:hypothetical protein DFH07DRAFT_984959 [Mycena maculata]|uniref:Uncharacterized protein n=1 Tax=Mycena maculata TaxID=230809 RepID=A0AAD7I9M7_9AGAR|nr:hypothetical protein DFH07DRAFT_984959 [Mycena maculata]